MSSQVSCGIVGLPNVGKSTLFNALTNNHVLAANYPFATIEPNTGTVPVPDKRLFQLAKLYNTQKIVPASIKFVDIAGLVKGASQGEGLGNQFLSHVRNVNLIVHVVRSFSTTESQDTSYHSSPKEDIDLINTELILADLQVAEKRLPRLEKEAKANPKLKPQYEALCQAYDALNSGKLLSSAAALDIECLGTLQFITLKPVLFVFNVDEAGLADVSNLAKLKQMVQPMPAICVCAKLEDELQGLDEPDRKEFLLSYDQNQPALEQLIGIAYNKLGLESFLTAGEKEVRSWTIPIGFTAQQAAGVIHTDFEHGFIAADIVTYKDIVQSGSWAVARASGKVHTAGKAYLMQPDDVVEFKYSV